MFGLGGIFVEVMKDVAFARRAAEPAGGARADARDQGLPGARGSARRARAVDLEAVEDLLLRVSRLVADFPTIAEMDLNPILAYPDGAGGRGRAAQGALRPNAVTHWIPIPVVALYLVVLFAVTGWARRLTARGGGGIVGYLLAGRGLPSWVAAALLAGLAVGGASTIGVAERAYTRRHLRRLVQRRLGRRRLRHGPRRARGATGASRSPPCPSSSSATTASPARVLGVIGQLVIQVVITSLQYVAGGAILCARLHAARCFTLPSGMVVTAVVFVGITLIGGFWAAGLTNVINVIVIYVGIVLGAVLTRGAGWVVSTRSTGRSAGRPPRLRPARGRAAR